MDRRRACGAWVLGAWLVAASASAQGVPVQLLEIGDGGARDGYVAAELGFFTGFEPRMSQVQSLLSLDLALMDAFDLTVEWAPGVTVLSEPVGFFDAVSDEVRVTPSNPTISAFYRYRSTALQFRVGAGLALPLTFFNETDEGAVIAELFSLSLRTGVWGGWDMWMLAPETLSIVVPAQLEARPIEYLALGLDLGVGFMLPVTDVGDRPAVYDLQVGPWVGVVAGPVVVGLRADMVTLFSSSIDPELSVALAPFVQADLGGGFLYTRFLANVSGDLFVTADTDLLWSLAIGGGAEW